MEYVRTKSDFSQILNDFKENLIPPYTRLKRKYKIFKKILNLEYNTTITYQVKNKNNAQ